MVKLNRPNVDLGIVCSDFEESLRFYRDVLSLPVVEEIRVSDEFASSSGLAPSGFRQVRLKTGEVLIKLMQIQTPPNKGSKEFAAGVRWLTLFVEDVRKVYDDLGSRGVTFLSEPLEAEGVSGVVCTTDPDGIIIEFVQP